MSSRPRDWNPRPIPARLAFAPGPVPFAHLPSPFLRLRGRHLAISILLSVSFGGACKRSAPPRLREGERRQITLRFKEVIERAGGSGVWVKGFQSEAFPSERTDATIEVVAVPASFDTVISAIKRQSERERLDIQLQEPRSRAGVRAVEVRLLRRDEPVPPLAGWRLREIPQLRRAAILIDDLGEDLKAARAGLELPYPLTFSILPYRRHSIETAQEAHRAGREVMLHLPMEPEPGSWFPTGGGGIQVGMPGDEVARIIQADLTSVPYAVGVNNHMGSRATTDVALMAAVSKFLNARRLYFVDSRTTAGSVALEVARRAGVPAFYRSVFLDDTVTTPYVIGQLRRFRHVVEDQGAALAIGHPHATTLAALAQFLPQLERDDIQLVPASQLVHLPEVARLSPLTAPPHAQARE